MDSTGSSVAPAATSDVIVIHPGTGAVVLDVSVVEENDVLEVRVIVDNVVDKDDAVVLEVSVDVEDVNVVPEYM